MPDDRKKTIGISLADYVGTGGQDFWYGTDDSDTAHGGEGNDMLAGKAGDDFLYGEGGDDELYGDDGNDLLDGGDGNDVLNIQGSSRWSDPSPGDRYVGGAGVDLLRLVGSDFLTADLRAVSIATDIEQIRASNAFVRLTRVQFLQFSSIEGAYQITGSGDFDLTGDRLKKGTLILDSGNDNVNLSGNHPDVSQGSLGVFGGAGNDQIIGSEAADALSGQADNDILEGRGGNDSLDGGDGDDILRGGAGNDQLWGYAGVDSYDGGDGDDTINVDFGAGFSAAEQISGGAGYDTLWVSGSGTIDFSTFHIADDFERLSAQAANVLASAAQLGRYADFEALSVTLTGVGNLVVSSNFNVREVICSDAGNGIDFSQLAFYGARAQGGAGADALTGSQRLDVLSGGGGNDVIHGGQGNDELDGGTGIDWIDGGAGNDRLTISQGDAANAGDRFTGGAGFDLLFVAGPTFGNDYYIVDLSAATIDGDVEAIDGNTMSGARLKSESLLGFTTIDVNVVYLTNGGSLDLTGKTCSVNGLYLSDDGNMVRLPDNGVFSVYGGAANDIVYVGNIGRTIRGGGGADQLYGGGDSDTLFGDAGNDILWGAGAGTVVPNNLAGGMGDDVYQISFQDLIIENVGEGFDTVYASVDYMLSGGAEVEMLSANDVAAVTALNLTGNEFAQTLIGNAGANILDGKAGADVMTGGAGNDIYIVDNAGDTVNEAANQGVDEVRTALAIYSIGNLANVENLTGTSTTGQTLTGNAGANILRGGTGDDTLVGGLGDDSYYINNAGDKIIEADDGGSDHAYASVNYVLAALQLVEILSTDNAAGTAALSLTGNEFANRIIGNAGNNILDGADGDDWLEGGAGNDRLIGGSGHDQMFGGSGADTFAFTQQMDSGYLLRSDGWKQTPDRIGDFASGEDRIDLSALDAIRATTADDGFAFIGTTAFSGTAGQLRYEVTSIGSLILADMDGDRIADFTLVTNASSLTSADFIL